MYLMSYGIFFFFQAEDGIRDGRVTGVQTCALPICSTVAAGRLSCNVAGPARPLRLGASGLWAWWDMAVPIHDSRGDNREWPLDRGLRDRKSTRLNSSHPSISYAVFCLKKKKQTHVT